VVVYVPVHPVRLLVIPATLFPSLAVCEVHARLPLLVRPVFLLVLVAHLTGWVSQGLKFFFSTFAGIGSWSPLSLGESILANSLSRTLRSYESSSCLSHLIVC
jgi:hypothetical protein